MAEVVPVLSDEEIDRREQELIAAGIIVPATGSPADIRPVARRRGALARFLRERRQ